jgi:hypothetical protein
MNKVLRWLAMVIAGAAAVCSIGSLAESTTMRIHLGISAPLIPAVPLLLTGVSFLLVQVVLRPRWPELMKNLLLAAAFILWGIVQLMEQNNVSRKLGDVVVALYVLDLAWVILTSANPVKTIRSSSLKSDSAGK